MNKQHRGYTTAKLNYIGVLKRCESGSRSANGQLSIYQASKLVKSRRCGGVGVDNLRDETFPPYQGRECHTPDMRCPRPRRSNVAGDWDARGANLCQAARHKRRWCKFSLHKPAKSTSFTPCIPPNKKGSRNLVKVSRRYEWHFN